MFEGFETKDIDTAGARIHLRHGGDGPPLLLLHGNPLTHVSWHLIAPRLAQDFHVVAMDLRGYGDSSAPDPVEDHSNYTFRAMAQDGVEVMVSNALAPYVKQIDLDCTKFMVFHRLKAEMELSNGRWVTA